jgi:hypothetical protein
VLASERIQLKEEFRSQMISSHRKWSKVGIPRSTKPVKRAFLIRLGKGNKIELCTLHLNLSLLKRHGPLILWLLTRQEKILRLEDKCFREMTQSVDCYSKLLKVRKSKRNDLRFNSFLTLRTN